MDKVAEEKILLGLSKALLKRINREATRQKVDRTRLIRRALTRYLEQMDLQQDREKGRNL